MTYEICPRAFEAEAIMPKFGVHSEDSDNIEELKVRHVVHLHEQFDNADNGKFVTIY